jgi:demethylmenaquinone methyltransferase/2-methoxy-6-polyprenyl-1,4-benzoquinol methylase
MANDQHAGHARQVSSMFGRIAEPYDFLNHFLSLGMDYRWRRVLVEMIEQGPTGRVLDLAAGTMDVTLAIRRARPQMEVLALDFALPMLSRGRDKAKEKNVAQVFPVLADGRQLPLPDACVDAATIAFGIRNIKPREDAFRELLRVLAPGGKLLVLEFGTARRPIMKGLYNLYLNRILPFIGGLFSGEKEAYSYLARTIGEFPHAGDLATEIASCGFKDVGYKALSLGIVNIHFGRKPA